MRPTIKTSWDTLREHHEIGKKFPLGHPGGQARSANNLESAKENWEAMGRKGSTLEIKTKGRSILSMEIVDLSKI